MENYSKSLRGAAMRRNLKVSFFFLLSSFLILTGCATKVRVNMLQPATFHQASLTKAVAVLPFSGKDGRKFAAELEGVLGSVSIDDKQYFTLVDRASLDKIIDEMKFSQSGLIDQKTAARIGKMVGAQGIYTGVVTLSKSQSSPYREERRECRQREIKYDKDGKPYEGSCINWRNYSVRCTKRTSNFEVTPKLIEVSTGRIVYSRNLAGSANSSGCEDRTLPAEEQELLTKAKDDVKNQFRRDVAPYYVTTEITLMESTDGIESKEAKDKFKAGIEYADKGRMDSACELWGAARILASSSFAILYDLGVCAESRGDADAALALYKQADKLLGKPDDDITLALNRVSAAIKNRKKLEEQLKSK
jgi:hypothetical protein